MKRFFVTLLFVLGVVTGCGSSALAAVLVVSPNGTYTTKADLATAATAADAAGKTVVVTTPQTLSANLKWPSDRTLRFQTGGYIVPNGYAITGLKESRPEQFGAKGDKVTDDTPAIKAALFAVSAVGGISTGGTFRCKGAYLFSSTITVPWGVDMVFEGTHSNAPNTPPTTYFYKKSGMSTDGIVFQDNTQGHNVSVVYQSGATGDGIHILGNSVRLYNPSVIGAGYATPSGNGIRIGKNTAGANSNSWYLGSPFVGGMSGHGIYVHDNPGNTPNANAGVMVNPIANINAMDGIRLENTINNTIIGPLAEGNGGVGFRIAAAKWSGNNIIIGGDTNEANASGTLALGVGTTYNAILGGDHHIIINFSGNTTNTILQPTKSFVTESIIANTTILAGSLYGVPTATLTTDSFSTAVASTSANLTLGIKNSIMLVDASGGPKTITLPSAVGITGRQYTIKKSDGTANAVTIAPISSQTIDGSAVQNLSVFNKFITVVSTGAVWVIIGQN